MTHFGVQTAFKGVETVTIRFAEKFYHELVVSLSFLLKFEILRFLAQISPLYRPFRGLNIVLGRRDHHHSICREILPYNSGLTFLQTQISNFSIFDYNKAFMATLGV